MVTRQCSGCQQQLEAQLFKSSGSECSKCATRRATEWNATHREARRNRYYLKRYGISLAEYQQLVQQQRVASVVVGVPVQQLVCAGCSQPLADAAVGIRKGVPGLYCRQCLLVVRGFQQLRSTRLGKQGGQLTRRQARDVLHRYDLTADEYHQLADQQGGYCAQCGKMPATGKLVISKMYRKLVCQSCSAQAVVVQQLSTAQEYHLRHTYGVTAEQYQQMLTEQHGCCGHCGQLPASGRLVMSTAAHQLVCRSCARVLRHSASSS